VTTSDPPSSMQDMKEANATMFVRHIPGDLKALIVAEAEEKQVGMNDLVVGVLAERFSIPFEPTGKLGTVDLGLSTDLVLRVPQRLRRSVAVEAARRGDTIKGVVCTALERHYGTGGGGTR
jgi:predicted HicB family RNase H-like nuclease